MEHVNQVNDTPKLGFFAVIETIWAIGTSVVANSAQL